MLKRDHKQMRAIGHKLKPVVTVAGKGLTEAVLLEIDRALSDHELIKIKMAVGEREARQALTREIIASSGAELVQSVGNVVLIVRRSAQPNPQLSNLLRY